MINHVKNIMVIKDKQQYHEMKHVKWREKSRREIALYRRKFITKSKEGKSTAQHVQILGEYN